MNTQADDLQRQIQTMVHPGDLVVAAYQPATDNLIVTIYNGSASVAFVVEPEPRLSVDDLRTRYVDPALQVLTNRLLVGGAPKPRSSMWCRLLVGGAPKPRSSMW